MTFKPDVAARFLEAVGGRPRLVHAPLKSGELQFVYAITVQTGYVGDMASFVDDVRTALRAARDFVAGAHGLDDAEDHIMVHTFTLGAVPYDKSLDADWEAVYPSEAFRQKLLGVRLGYTVPEYK